MYLSSSAYAYENLYGVVIIKSTHYDLPKIHAYYHYNYMLNFVVLTLMVYFMVVKCSSQINGALHLCYHIKFFDVKCIYIIMVIYETIKTKS